MSEAANQLAKWYVVQVRTGTEEAMCQRIERACHEHDRRVEDKDARVELAECFSPRFATQKKWKGEWRDIERLLLPGYVIAVTRKPERLAEAVRVIRDLCKLLSDGETYTPLNEGERAWLERITRKGGRVLPMSFAHKIGDELEVTEGPLVGHTGKIVKIDRANSLAHLEFHVGQMTIRTTVGLGVIPVDDN